MADPTVGDAITAAATQYGLDPAVLKGIAHIESSWNPGSNRDKPTQYKGLFQMGRDEWKQHGSGDIYNAQDNANAAARLLSSHSQWFQKNYGREPTPGELYMMHQQGRGFISKGIMTNIAGNPYPGMQGPQTPESFQKGWTDTLARRMAQYGGPSTAVADAAGGPVPVPAPTPGGWGPLAGLFGGSTTPVPGAAAAPVHTSGLLSDPTADMTDPAKRVAAAQKIMEDEKAAAGDKQSKALMAMAQQFMTAGQGAQRPQFAQFQPMETGPFRPLPLNLPAGFGTGRRG